MECWWNDGMQTMRWKQWIKLKLLILPLTLLARVPLLAQLCICQNTTLLFICGEWYKKILPHCCIFKILTMTRGSQKCPQKPNKQFCPPPPPPPRMH